MIKSDTSTTLALPGRTQSEVEAAAFTPMIWATLVQAIEKKSAPMVSNPENNYFTTRVNDEFAKEIAKALRAGRTQAVIIPISKGADDRHYGDGVENQLLTLRQVLEDRGFNLRQTNEPVWRKQDSVNRTYDKVNLQLVLDWSAAEAQRPQGEFHTAAGLKWLAINSEEGRFQENLNLSIAEQMAVWEQGRIEKERILPGIKQELEAANRSYQERCVINAYANRKGFNEKLTPYEASALDDVVTHLKSLGFKASWYAHEVLKDVDANNKDLDHIDYQLEVSWKRSNFPDLYPFKDAIDAEFVEEK